MVGNLRHCSYLYGMKKFKDTLVAKIITERWKGKDVETYFEEKNKLFIEKLKKEVVIKSNMTRIEQIRSEFKGFYGAIDLYLYSGTTVYFIDVDGDVIEGYSSVTASCGCCSELVDFEESLSRELEYMDDETFDELVDELRKLK